MMDFNVPIIKLSDYMSSMKGRVEDFIKNNNVININNTELKIKNEYEYEVIETLPVSMNFLTLIVNDNQVGGMNIYIKFLSFNYKGNKEDIEKKVLKDFEEVENNSNKECMVKISVITKMLCFENNMVTANIFLFVGIVFLIASAAVLALSQLSGATESIERYKVLRKLGVSTEMINKSIFVQVLLYFFLPIGLALVHSIYGIKVANNVIKVFGDYNMIGNNILSIGAILIVYGIYFLATYNGYKKIVNND